MKGGVVHLSQTARKKREKKLKEEGAPIPMDAAGTYEGPWPSVRAPPCVSGPAVPETLGPCREHFCTWTTKIRNYIVGISLLREAYAPSRAPCEGATATSKPGALARATINLSSRRRAPKWALFLNGPPLYVTSGPSKKGIAWTWLASAAFFPWDPYGNGGPKKHHVEGRRDHVASQDSVDALPVPPLIPHAGADTTKVDPRKKPS